MDAALALELELPERVRSGTPVTGSLRILNHRAEPIELASPSSPATLNLVVFDQLWNVVRAEPQGKANVARHTFRLAPGESATYELEDLRYLTGSALMAVRLQPGTYHVVALYHPGTDRLPEQSDYPVTVASNVARIEVR
ncbi:MAG: hypothetical protein M3N52_00840 [Actinomycetota bacterium]|nr:hypothetical protein [Actinomycetota bacterium]